MVAPGYRTIRPVRRFQGHFRLPGDKSVSHRLAILAALAEGTSRFGNFSTAGDCASTLACLEALGVEVRRGETVSVTGRGADGLRAPSRTLDAGNSGSTLRMLAGVLAGRPFRSVLDGDASLRGRPVERVAAPLRAMGARIETTTGRPPMTIDGGPLTGADHTLAVASAQVKTAILLAGLQADGRTSVAEPAASRDHTERLLPCFGVPVRTSGTTVSVERARLTPFDMTAPGDPSSAAFLVVAALIVRDGRVRIDGVLLNPSRIAFLDVLRRMGGAIRVGVDTEAPEPVGWIEAETSALRGTEIGPLETPSLIDELPILAVAASHARGETVVRGAGELRAKESNRIEAVVEELRRVGGHIRATDDGYRVRGVPARLRGGVVDSRGDHRLAMLGAVVGVASREGVELRGSEAAAVSFPGFFDVLDQVAPGSVHYPPAT